MTRTLIKLLMIVENIVPTFNVTCVRPNYSCVFGFLPHTCTCTIFRLQLDEVSFSSLDNSKPYNTLVNIMPYLINLSQ